MNLDTAWRDELISNNTTSRLSPMSLDSLDIAWTLLRDLNSAVDSNSDDLAGLLHNAEIYFRSGEHLDSAELKELRAEYHGVLDKVYGYKRHLDKGDSL